VDIMMLVLRRLEAIRIPSKTAASVAGPGTPIISGRRRHIKISDVQPAGLVVALHASLGIRQARRRAGGAVDSVKHHRSCRAKSRYVGRRW
jgi:hypothetical protein